VGQDKILEILLIVDVVNNISQTLVIRGVSIYVCLQRHHAQALSKYKAFSERG
jgi:hypothetical protein